jgi:uncharacterized protein YndB with AHSA1/START domain
MKEIRKEYLLKTTQNLLYNRISSASGLSEWFADDVLFEGKIVVFKWGETTQKAKIVNISPNESIRFRWLESGLTTEFEFAINEDELTGDIALIITDHIEEDEEEDAVILWNSQISRLKHAIGS